MSILVNRPDNRRRPVDWRWQRACELAEGARLVRGRDDEGVMFASKFRRLLDRCTTDEDKLEALDAHPEMYEAYSIYDASEEATEIRWELEARILAKESPQAIDKKLGVSPEVAKVFGRIFFDVADRLEAHSLITHVVIGRAVQTGLAEREYDCLWKLFGYWSGPLVLDAFIYKFNCPSHTETHDGLRGALREFTKDTIEQKGAITMLTMKVNWQTQETIMNLWQQCLQMEIQAGAAGAGTETIMQNVTVMMEGFQGLLHKHIPDVDPSPGGIISAVEDTGVRLRSGELAAIGMGLEPTGLEHLITAKFPEKGEDK